MIIGIGSDLCNIERIQGSVDRFGERFEKRVFTDVERAKTLCHNCPVRQACLAGALERQEPWGVWGGEWFVQGVAVPRKRPRGRPRKSEVAA